MATFYIDSVKGNDTSIGTAPDNSIKSMIGINKVIPLTKKGDSIVISGTPIWGIQTGIDAESNPIFEIIPGIIHYHYLPKGQIRTFMQIGDIFMRGMSSYGIKGEIETKIDMVEKIKVIPVIVPVVIDDKEKV